MTRRCASGILAGNRQTVERIRRNPLFRALRIDKLITQTLESTLRNLLLERWDAVPALAMIRQSAGDVRRRAEALLAQLSQLKAELLPGESVIGGGATPQQSIPTCLITIDLPDPVAAERRLRANNPPVVARIVADRIVLDLRTVLPGEEAELAAALDTLA